MRYSDSTIFVTRPFYNDSVIFVISSVICDFAQSFVILLSRFVILLNYFVILLNHFVISSVILYFSLSFCEA